MSTVHAVGFTDPLPVSNPRSLKSLTIDLAAPGPHDLVIAVRAVSVNPVDVKVRGSARPDANGRVLGFDVAGTVVEVGSDVTLFAAGDDVFATGSLDRPGSNADMVVIDERIVGRKPSSISFTDAAALPLTALTAWEGLFDKLRLTPTSTGTLLLVGGAGGVGSMVIQILAALVPGVRVIATASRPASRDWVMALGADDVVDHHGDLRAQVRNLVPNGVDWVFTTNSRGQLPTYEAICRPFGQIVAIDDPVHVDVVPLKAKALSWHWEFMFARSSEHASDVIRQHEILDDIADLVDAGRIRTTATTTFPTMDPDTLRDAHRLVEDGSVIGKVVLTHRAPKKD